MQKVVDRISDFLRLFTGMLYSDDLLDFSDIILYNRINLKYMKNKGEE